LDRSIIVTLLSQCVHFDNNILLPSCRNVNRYFYEMVVELWGVEGIAIFFPTGYNITIEYQLIV